MRTLCCFLCLLLAAALPAQTEKRYALVVGNGAYTYASLGQTPLNDARDMAAALTKAGFEVTLRENRRLDELNNDLTEFSRLIRGSGAVALFYYSGHGLQYEGRNFLVPIGAELTDEYDIDAKCVPVDRLTSKMQAAGTPLNIVIFDACRAYPVARGSKELRAGFAEMPRVPEMLVAYATAPGTVADVRGEGGHSLYTNCLLQHLPTPGLQLEDVFKNTRRDVIARSGGAQRPEETSNLTYYFYFVAGLPTPTPEPVTSQKPVELPAAITAQPVATPPVADSRCSWCPEMVFVQGGRFRMGSENDNLDAQPNEKPAHLVTVPDFWIGKYEATNGQYVQFLNENTQKITLNDKGEVVSLNGQQICELLCGSCTPFVDMIRYDNGSVPGGEFTVRTGYEDFPVVMVSWYGAQAYAAWLSGKTGQSYRLPSESEWEYAARGGARSQGFKFAGSNNADEVAWYDKTAGGKRQFRVGQKKPNELGLYDLSGNVWEWCADYWHGTYAGTPRDGSAWTEGSDSYRVLRGGAWEDLVTNVRASVRRWYLPHGCVIIFGFRLARTP